MATWLLLSSLLLSLLLVVLVIYVTYRFWHDDLAGSKMASDQKGMGLYRLLLVIILVVALAIFVVNLLHLINL
ncbi:hypothetical protein OZX60_06875 [Streptococcaceae bacterium ESL0687]|nr:hypothetical protein OZX60_06875 [Streptococcaceae bacterium ESL0687]